LSPGENRSNLDNLPWVDLNNDMRRITPNKQSTWARQQARVLTQLDALDRQAQVLVAKIEAATAASQPTQALASELDALRRRSTHLAELGAALELERSEAHSIDHSQPGQRWHPTTADPF
jgi:transposase